MTDITAQEIKDIRGKYGLSQQSFARLLGIGEASMVRYENGKKPTKANANLIRAAANPEFMLDCIRRDGESLSANQRQKAEQIVYALVSFGEEGDVMDINDIYTLTLEQEILNEKAAEVMADIERKLKDAQEEHDKIGELVYESALLQIALAKASIFDKENQSIAKACEIRGRIDAIADFSRKLQAKAA